MLLIGLIILLPQDTNNDAKSLTKISEYIVYGLFLHMVCATKCFRDISTRAAAKVRNLFGYYALSCLRLQFFRVLILCMLFLGQRANARQCLVYLQSYIQSAIIVVRLERCATIFSFRRFLSGKQKSTLLFQISRLSLFLLKRQVLFNTLA
jgi:hypothetical protein